MSEKLEIPTDALQKNFEEFLGIENNNRIFFSAPYGTGKTYFLKDFFSQREKKFEFFHLAPVNYQITSTERILDFLKYDLLVELQSKASDRGISIFEHNGQLKNIGTLTASFIKENFHEGVDKVTPYILGGASIATMTPLFLLNRPISEVNNLIKTAREHVAENPAEERIVDNFIVDIEQDPSIGTEEDLISQIIKAKVSELKGEQKKSVLILDDIDRIDPEHIFRILNTFSAHTMQEENGTRFEFDYIIIVGDRNNIKHIFQHRNGEGANFDGYFDKFVSIRPYHFNNESLIKEYLDNILDKAQVSEEVSQIFENKIDSLRGAFCDLLLQGVDQGKVNIRKLRRIVDFKITPLTRNHSSPLKRGEDVEIFIETLFEMVHRDKSYFRDLIYSIRNNLEETTERENGGSSEVEQEKIIKLLNNSYWIEYLLELLELRKPPDENEVESIAPDFTVYGDFHANYRIEMKNGEQLTKVERNEVSSTTPMPKVDPTPSLPWQKSQEKYDMDDDTERGEAAKLKLFYDLLLEYIDTKLEV